MPDAAMNNAKLVFNTSFFRNINYKLKNLGVINGLSVRVRNDSLNGFPLSEYAHARRCHEQRQAGFQH
jgi:hypothetical protein